MSDVSKVNLVINRGTTFRHKFIYKDEISGRVVDLTGYVARMQARPDALSDIVLVELTTENSGIVLGGRAGTISLYINDTSTSLLAWAKGVYDIELVSPLGEVFRAVYGSLTTSLEITRPVV